jgi:hypothetical protein
MRLREFSLSARTGERPSPDSVQHRFGLQTRCVTALFERVFPKFMESRGWKVLVECVAERPDEKVRNQLGVLTIQEVLDVRGFLAAAPREKKVVTLETLWRGITRVAAAEQWPLQPFEEARRAVLERDYVNEWSWPGKPALERRSGRKAQLQCQHEIDAFRAWAVVTGKDGLELTRKLVLEKPPHEFQFVPSLGALVWSGPDRVKLEAQNGSVVAEIDVVEAHP